ncbi:MAG: manno-octulosonate cytidylyltransferase [Pseudomonadota bacterium]
MPDLAAAPPPCAGDRALILIPARYASNRYPGKPLALLRGAGGAEKTLIERCCEAAEAARAEDAGVMGALVATDDERIAAAVRGFGGRVVMTDPAAPNGTARCADAMARLRAEGAPEAAAEIVVNLQGDAPLTPPWFVTAVINALRADPGLAAATPAVRCDGRALAQFREDRRAGRVGGTTVVTDLAGDALYFSKEVIPFTEADFAPEAETPVLHHVGLYAYRPAALARYMAAETTRLETLEGLEQLRFLAIGERMRVVEVPARGRVFWELNNPVDAPRIEAALAEMNQP